MSPSKGLSHDVDGSTTLHDFVISANTRRWGSVCFFFFFSPGGGRLTVSSRAQKSLFQCSVYAQAFGEGACFGYEARIRVGGKVVSPAR